MHEFTQNSDPQKRLTTVLFEKPTVAQIVKNSPHFDETRRFIINPTVFPGTRH
jgi:hypothetical protein